MRAKFKFSFQNSKKIQIGPKNQSRNYQRKRDFRKVKFINGIGIKGKNFARTKKSLMLKCQEMSLEDIAVKSGALMMILEMMMIFAIYLVLMLKQKHLSQFRVIQKTEEKLNILRKMKEYHIHLSNLVEMIVKISKQNSL